MKYPVVMSEDDTLDDALAGGNLARYGDGELSLALGRDCVSQAADKTLAAELRRILVAPSSPTVLPCIPNVFAKGTKPAWAKYAAEKYVALYAKGQHYGSAFITRPDSAPWIDRPDYWAKVEALWKGRRVVLVKGTERSLRLDMMQSAAQVVELDAPSRDAWAVAADLQRQIEVAHAEQVALHFEASLDNRLPVEAERPIVLLCVGATSTVLADRLAALNIHAVDAGHVGMFARHAGSYAIKIDGLISDGYREQLLALRRARRWGGDGHKHADTVAAYADAVEAETVLDYGCGEQTLATALKGRRRVMGYDPGVEGREGQPKPCDLVVSTDVLEHVERDKLAAVLRHMFDLAGKAGYFVVACRPAKAILPDGRNAHLIVEPPAWWVEQVKAVGWRVERVEAQEGREVRLWLRK